MNSCILMARLLEDPQLRYTQESNLEMSQMMVEFAGFRPDEPSAHLRVIAWGNVAKEIKEKYREGDRVIIEGRLSMNVIERDGVKEKKAEITAQRLYPLSNESNLSSGSPSNYVADEAKREEPEPVVSMNAYKSKTEERKTNDTPVASNARIEPKTKAPIESSVESTEKDLDDIPFVRSVDSKILAEGLLDSYEIYSQCPEVGVSHNFKFI
jgi:single-stranded DNA-binding protein